MECTSAPPPLAAGDQPPFRAPECAPVVGITTTFECAQRALKGGCSLRCSLPTKHVERAGAAVSTAVGWGLALNPPAVGAASG